MRFVLAGVVLLLCCGSAVAQTGHKYDYYRHPESQSVAINPFGWLLGRVDAHFEDRLDPNFSRSYEFAYQPDIRKDKQQPIQTAYTVGAIERIYLIDNAAILGQFVGLGGGVGMVSKTFCVRLTAEIGYKLLLGSGPRAFFLEPELLLDSYIVGNHHIRRVIPYFALPFGYAW